MTGDPISLKRRTTSEVDPYRMELSHGAMRVQYDLDLNAPSQRFIYDCCQGGGVYEATTAFLLTQVLRPGDTFVDVGAHVGFFAMIAGAIVGPSGRVVAFEPNAENFAALKNNATLNGFAHVTCINAAVGDRDGEAAFFENLDNDGGHALWDPGLHPFNEQSCDRQAVRRLPIVRLDTVLPSLGVGPVKAVKIDTEGAEVQVLYGGRRCLADPRLALLVCEDNEFGLERMGTSGVDLRRALDKLGFAVCVLDGKGGLQQVAVDAPHQAASVDNFYCVRPPKP